MSDQLPTSKKGGNVFPLSAFLFVCLQDCPQHHERILTDFLHSLLRPEFAVRNHVISEWSREDFSFSDYF